VWKLAVPGVVTCPKCGAFRLPHRMCKSCMTYNGREFGQVNEANYSKKEHLPIDRRVFIFLRKNNGDPFGSPLLIFFTMPVLKFTS
jgi:large subunit ribosomal protein L32